MSRSEIWIYYSDIEEPEREELELCINEQFDEIVRYYI